jgi:hypothetical protein
MISMPLAILLLIGIWVSLAKGRGTPWFGIMCITLGIVVANTALGTTIMNVVNSVVSVAIAAGQSITGGG